MNFYVNNASFFVHNNLFFFLHALAESFGLSFGLHGSCVQSQPRYPGDFHLNPHALS